MSRQVAASVQTGDLDSVVINHDLGDFTCVITGQILFDPVMTHCGQHIERSASAKLKRCPCCNEPNIQFNDACAYFKRDLQKAIQQHGYKDVYFDLEGFKQVVAKRQLNTPQGARFLTLLQNATSHLNTKELIRTETQVTHPVFLEIPQVTIVETQGKSPIEILAESSRGRDCLRKQLKIASASSATAAASGSEKYLFGNAELSAESLQTQVNGSSIRVWLNMTTAMEVAQFEEHKARHEIKAEAQTAYCQLQTQFFRARLFLLRGARGAATGGQRIPSDTVNPILQQVVYGNENAVRTALEAIESNSEQLFALLSDTGTVKDYSDRTITGMTLLQAAAAAGDIEMCLMLKNYMTPEEFVCQLAEIFPEGIEANEEVQKQNAFNFDAILVAIRSASTTDLDAALNKQNNGSALCLALEAFRDEFKTISIAEKIFNPHHLLKAFEVYNALWEQCDANGTIDPDYEKRDLFWRQIIGYIQRFMPACYAQAFAQGLYYLVKVDQSDSWRAEPLKRALKLRCDDFSYFPLSGNSRSGLGFDFAICGEGWRVWRRLCVWAGRACFQKLLSSKNSRLSEHYAANARAVTDVGTLLRDSVMR